MPAPASPKRSQVLDSLADNELALVVTSPLVAGAPSARKRVEHATTLGPNQRVDALTALLLSERGFKAQTLEAAPPPPPQKSLPSSSSLKGGKRDGSSKLSISSTPALVVQRHRMELEAQLLLVRALGGPVGGGGGGSASSCSSFAVRLNSGPTLAAAAAAARNRARRNKEPGGSSRDSGVGVDSVSGGGSGSDGCKRGEAKTDGGNGKKIGRETSGEESKDGVLALQEERGGNEFSESPSGAKEAASSSAVFAVAADDAYGSNFSAAPACELCVVRDGVPYPLPRIV